MLKQCHFCGEDIEEQVIKYDLTGKEEECPDCGIMVPHWTDRFIGFGGPRPQWGYLTIRLTEQNTGEIKAFEEFWHKIEISSQLAFCMGQFEIFTASGEQNFVSFAPEAIVERVRGFFKEFPEIGQIKSFEILSVKERRPIFLSFNLQPRPPMLPFDPLYDE